MRIRGLFQRLGLGLATMAGSVLLFQPALAAQSSARSPVRAASSAPSSSRSVRTAAEARPERKGALAPRPEGPQVQPKVRRDGDGAPPPRDRALLLPLQIHAQNPAPQATPNSLHVTQHVPSVLRGLRPEQGGQTGPPGRPAPIG